MPKIELETNIRASVETVFDLSRCVDLHVESTAQTNERAVAGKTSGLLELGDTVTWEATHFFVRQQLTVVIAKYERPNFFRDTMQRGIFRRFDHDHYFEQTDSGTRMRDVFDYSLPYGLFGQAANMLLVNRHMRKLLVLRNELIKSVAESPLSYRYLNSTSVAE